MDSLNDESQRLTTEKSLDGEGNMFRRETVHSLREEIQKHEESIAKESKNILEETQKVQLSIQTLFLDGIRRLSTFKNAPSLPDVPLPKSANNGASIRQLVELFEAYDRLTKEASEKTCTKCQKSCFTEES